MFLPLRRRRHKPQRGRNFPLRNKAPVSYCKLAFPHRRFGFPLSRRAVNGTGMLECSDNCLVFSGQTDTYFQLCVFLDLVWHQERLDLPFPCQERAQPSFGFTSSNSWGHTIDPLSVSFIFISLVASYPNLSGTELTPTISFRDIAPLFYFHFQSSRMIELC